MASSVSFSFFFVLLILSVGVMVESRQVKKVVVKVEPSTDNGNEDIEKVCTASLGKEVCLNCINADHSRDTNGMRDLTHSIIFCTWSQATFARTDANQLFQNTTDAELKKLYEFCDTKLHAAENEFFDSMILFENYHYKNSARLMYTANQKLGDCSYKIEKVDPRGIQVPQHLHDDISPTNRLYNVFQTMMPLVKLPSTPLPAVAA